MRRTADTTKTTDEVIDRFNCRRPSELTDR
jgi:hypothetical protein